MDFKKYFLIFFSSLVFFLNPFNVNAEGIEPKNSKKQIITASLNTKISKPVDEWYKDKFVFPEEEFNEDGRSLFGKKLMDEEMYFLTRELTKGYNIAPFDRKSIEEDIDNLAMKNLCKRGWGELKKGWNKFKQETEVGAKCQKIERYISSASTTSYLKNKGKRGKFYSFGQLDPDELDKKREISASLKWVFYTDKFFKEKNYSAIFDFISYRNKIKAIYDVTKKDDVTKKTFGISFTNEKINSYLGEKIKVLVYGNQEFEGNLEKRVGIQMSFNFDLFED